MNANNPDEENLRQRNLLFLTVPALWPEWPFLPLVRWRGGAQELGLLYDVFHRRGLPGYTATVFLGNLFSLPRTEEEFLALPRESFDTPEEIYAAGWRID